MFGLEHVVATQPARITAPTNEQELERATMFVKRLREWKSNFFTHDELNEVADLLVSAYGIDE